MVFVLVYNIILEAKILGLPAAEVVPYLVHIIRHKVFFLLRKLTLHVKKEKKSYQKQSLNESHLYSGIFKNIPVQYCFGRY